MLREQIEYEITEKLLTKISYYFCLKYQSEGVIKLQLTLGDILDAQLLENLMHNLYNIIKLPVSIVNDKGETLVKHGYSKLCTNIDCECCTNHSIYQSCLKDTCGNLKKGQKVLQCKCGLTIHRYPVYIMESNIANILLSELLEGDYDCKIKPYANLIESIIALIGDMYTKSLTKDIMKKREEIALRRKQLINTVITMGSMIEKRDLYTAKHQKKVAYLACKIATKMGLEKEKFEGLYIAAMLHDIGKIGIPAEILTKPDKLTRVEFEMIKSHVQIAYDILSKIEFPWPVADIVLQHHEKLNGSGYPFGLSSKEISLEAKILSVADVVEAITAHRPYRPALGLSYALEEIKAFSGVYYEPEVVEACVDVCTENNWDKMIDKALTDKFLINKELFCGL